MTFHTKLSTWVAVVSLLLTTFSALPTLTSLCLHAVNVPVLVLLVYVSRKGW